MGSVQRAFAQKLSKQHATDVRRQIAASAAASYSRDSAKGSNLTSFVSLSDIVDPLDYEDFVHQHQQLISRDPLRPILEFPANDIDVSIIPRKIRTLRPTLPEEPLAELPAQVRDCVASFTKDWVLVDYQYRHHSSSSWPPDRHLPLDNLPQQEFEDSSNAERCVCQYLGYLNPSLGMVKGPKL